MGYQYKSWVRLIESAPPLCLALNPTSLVISYETTLLLDTLRIGKTAIRGDLASSPDWLLQPGENNCLPMLPSTIPKNQYRFHATILFFVLLMINFVFSGVSSFPISRYSIILVVIETWSRSRRIMVIQRLMLLIA